jgi:GNAT superfamily N-acetyltransferase
MDDMHSFAIRHATPADSAAIFELHVASIRAHCTGHYTPEQIEAWIAPKRPENYARAMNDGEAMFVAESAMGALAGFGSIQGDEVHAVYVAPGRAGGGIGSALLGELEAHARRAGVRVIRLRSSINAVGFYERHGYRRPGDGGGGFRAAGVEIPCIALSKELDRT